MDFVVKSFWGCLLSYLNKIKNIKEWLGSKQLFCIFNALQIRQIHSIKWLEFGLGEKNLIGISLVIPSNLYFLIVYSKTVLLFHQFLNCSLFIQVEKSTPSKNKVLLTCSFQVKLQQHSNKTGNIYKQLVPDCCCEVKNCSEEPFHSSMFILLLFEITLTPYFSQFETSQISQKCQKDFVFVIFTIKLDPLFVGNSRIVEGSKQTSILW